MTFPKAKNELSQFWINSFDVKRTALIKTIDSRTGQGRDFKVNETILSNHFLLNSIKLVSFTTGGFWSLLPLTIIIFFDTGLLWASDRSLSRISQFQLTEWHIEPIKFYMKTSPGKLLECTAMMFCLFLIEKNTDE